MRHSRISGTVLFVTVFLLSQSLSASDTSSAESKANGDIFTTGIVTRLAGEYYLQTQTGRLKMQGISPSIIQHYIGDTVSIKGHQQYNYVDVYEVSVERDQNTEVVFDWYAIDADVYNE